ncbi:MAG TPA: sugar phosphate nucleotidyltransferase [Candidatus Saccharimonadales bacterium]|nr:sugar phosphate nucleotidyltransferase [Candidatus Saccharimonadales bacterium]
MAGWGTRWLPLTKSIEKCMLPVGTRPVIDWVVADCVRAGVTRIIFVIGKEHVQIRHYYSHNAELEQYLTDKNKVSALEAVRQPEYEGVRFEFVVQPKDTYGTAIPLALAAAKLDADESFLFLNGDDFIYRPDGGTELGDMIAAWQESGADGAVMTKVIPKAEASKYGVVFSDADGAFVKIHEKPSQAELGDLATPSVNLGKYILNPHMLRLTAAYVAQPTINADGEYYVTDICNQAAQEGQHLRVHYITGEHLDAGNPTNWLHANQTVLQQ